jgi:hypothetical protein
VKIEKKTRFCDSVQILKSEKSIPNEMNLKKLYLGKMQLMLLAICIIGFIDSIKVRLIVE